MQRHFHIYPIPFINAIAHPSFVIFIVSLSSMPVMGSAAAKLATWLAGPFRQP